MIPQDVDAEQCVLGAMMLSKGAIGEVIGLLQAGDFYRPAHEQVFSAMCELYVSGEPVDPVTVADELLKRGELERVGGHIYLHHLLESVSIAGNATYYAQIVREKAVLRRLVDASQRIAQLGYAGRGEVDQIVDVAQQAILAVTAENGGYSPIDAGAASWSVIDEIEARKGKNGMLGIPSGILPLDELTRGFRPGQLIVIGARPGVGKSSLALEIARNVSIRAGKRVAYFSLEMAYQELVEKMLAAESKIPLRKLQTGDLTEAEWAALGAVPALPEGRLKIFDQVNTSTQVRAEARKLAQTEGLDLIIVDYLQLMVSGRRVENRQQEVAEFSRQMKLLAKELGVPVIALSQLNRASETKADKRPSLSELRESGALEQDADVVILMHEPPREHAERGRRVDLIVAKHRSGEKADIKMLFQTSMSAFTEVPEFR
ncbi:MAG: replicative DNA helicase [Propionibacteriaceae bacterium]|jgi:replicative DNA helicase|nr:replicative DNA helicase [Propionibacteriaceae bacterium]